ncbi:universal stress protein [Streptomyces sp. SP17BM10]|uniref:universal stress protein n=1 Tax=Streptomyces sp. SP17BM10 TaxID=3002530 RepID=UPI002E77ADBF|nr:universal stress protein [Streptomyces sp. SP17BM10]MEE1786695.1 universal stress protein [Streptomyces sp. SP17BM10]
MELPVTVGVDGSSASLRAADLAAEEALLRGRGLRVLHALPLMPHLLSGRDTRPRCGERSALAQVRHVLAVRHPELAVRAEEVHDVATAALVAAAEEAELLVLAARGDGGFPGLRVGATALHVAARAGCPVLVTPAAEDPVPRDHVLVAVNARCPAGAALDFAFDLARRHGLALRAVHAWPPGGPGRSERELLSTALAPWRAAYPDVPLTEDDEPGGAGQVLVEASVKARFLVLGRRRSTPVGRLGPVAHAALHHAGCAVAIVPES